MCRVQPAQFLFRARIRVHLNYERRVAKQPAIATLLQYNHRKKHFSFLERCWEQKRVIISASACTTNNLDDGHEKTRSSVVKVKIVFRRLRKKDPCNTYSFSSSYFLSGTRQSAKNSFHIMPDNKHTHTHKFSQWAFSCAATQLSICLYL